VLNGQKGSMSTYRCPQWSLHAKSACTKRCLHTKKDRNSW